MLFGASADMVIEMGLIRVASICSDSGSVDGPSTARRGWAPAQAHLAQPAPRRDETRTATPPRHQQPGTALPARTARAHAWEGKRTEGRAKRDGMMVRAW